MRIYLDHNATTPVDPVAAEAMMRALQDLFGNASSVHYYGQQAKAAIDTARSAIAALIGGEPSEIIFTSGGTEADNFAIRGVAEAQEVTGRKHLITSGIEHEAVLNTFKALGAKGVEDDRAAPRRHRHCVARPAPRGHDRRHGAGVRHARQ
jgi:cysteine desulfurase